MKILPVVGVSIKCKEYLVKPFNSGSAMSRDKKQKKQNVIFVGTL